MRGFLLRRFVLLGLVLLVVFWIGGSSAVGTTLKAIAVGTAVAIALVLLIVWLVRRKVRKEMRRLQSAFLGGLGQAMQPPPPQAPRDEAIDADFQVRRNG